MTAVARLDLAIFDAADINRAGGFYADLTGWDVIRQDAGRVGLRTPDGREIEFQRAPGHVPPIWPGQERPQQFHLDLQTGDSRAQAERAVRLGATRLADGPTWITLADPAGHPFDLYEAAGVGPVMGLSAVTIDAPDAAALAGFYAALTGMEKDGTLLTGVCGRLKFQQVTDYNAPRWPDPAYPQQAHLDLLVEDVDEGSALAVDLGARPLNAGGERYRVFADPAGHPFCLIW
jgi:catechol 2,3-dioxygenase-like lactoylglutathione lyase family enzyme